MSRQGGGDLGLSVWLDNKPLNLDWLFNHKEILYIIEGQEERSKKKRCGEIKTKLRVEGRISMIEYLPNNVQTRACAHTHTHTSLQGTNSKEEFHFLISEWSIYFERGKQKKGKRFYIMCIACMVAYPFIPSTLEAEVGQSLWVWGQSSLHMESQISQKYIVRLYFNKHIIKCIFQKAFSPFEHVY